MKKQKIENACNRLYKEAQIKSKKIKDVQLEREEREKQECTFMPNIQKYTKMRQEKEKFDRQKKPVTTFKHDADLKPKRNPSPNVIKLPVPLGEKEGEQRQPNHTPFEKSEQGEPNGSFDPKFVSNVDGVPKSPPANPSDTAIVSQTLYHQNTESQPNSQEVIEPEYNDLSDTTRNKDDLFDYLAYNGIKSIKAIENNRVKKQRDLAECTFVPKINKKRPNSIDKQRNASVKKQPEVKFAEDEKTPVHEKLAQQKRPFERYELSRVINEMKDCTFTPRLAPMSKKLAQNRHKERNDMFHRVRASTVMPKDKKLVTSEKLNVQAASTVHLDKKK